MIGESRVRLGSTCRACGTVANARTFLARELMFGTGEEFDYVECPRCGTVQIDVVPKNLASHYPPDYYSMRPRSSPKSRGVLKSTLVARYAIEHARNPEGWRARMLQTLLPIPTEWPECADYLKDSGLRSLDDPILDVGCGSSPQLLASLFRLGFRNLLGIDPFVSSDLVFQGVTVKRQEISESDGHFAWIMFHHSLEHVVDPVAALTAAAERLRPEGRCLVRVPIVGGWMWRHYGTQWVEFDAPRHLHLFSSEGLCEAAARAGFAVETCIHESQGWELAWSEAYQQGVSMEGPRTRPLKELFTAEEMQQFSERACTMNRVHSAGRAAFVLKKA